MPGLANAAGMSPSKTNTKAAASKAASVNKKKSKGEGSGGGGTAKDKLASKTLIGSGGGEEKDESDSPCSSQAAAPNPRTEAPNPLAEAFWAEQDAAPFWTVPIAHGATMPWLKVHERGLLVAIERAYRMGKTVLLIDNTEEHIVDTFYVYQAALVLEAKSLVLDAARGVKSIDEILEGCRMQLVNSMRYGQTLYIRLADSACDFKGMFSSPDRFPLEVFDRRHVSGLQEYREGTANNLWGSSHPLAAALRETDLVQGGIFQPRFGHKEREADGSLAGFEVVVCTQFGTAEFEQFLHESLPFELIQPIKSLPSSVQIKYNHYKNSFELGIGGTLAWGQVDDMFALSFVFKGNFGVRLLEAGAEPGQVGVERDAHGIFHRLRGGATYTVTIEEDEAAEAEARGQQGGGTTRLSAADLAATQMASLKMSKKLTKGVPGRSDDGSSQTSKLLRDELRNLSADEIKEGSERFRALREASDFQDVVFGGGS